MSPMPPPTICCCRRRRGSSPCYSARAAAAASTFLLFCFATTASANSPSELFIRIDRRQLDTAPSLSLSHVASADWCATVCLNQTKFRCLSFDYDDVLQTCRLHNGSALQHALLPSIGADHYQGTFQRMFTRLVGCFVPAYLTKWEQLRIEQCASKCLATSLCTGFLSRILDDRHYCMLSNGTLQRQGLQVMAVVNYYERTKGRTMSNFINYGPGVRSGEASQQHESVLTGVDMESCAHECLTNSSIKCASFDYLMTTRQCFFWSEETVGQLVWPRDRIDIVHYERKGRYTDFFWPLLYQGLPGVSPLRQISSGSSPGSCAKLCLEESQFVCRSFAFVMPNSSCELYAVSAGDFGTLYDAVSASRQSHYYVLKPIYYCGGVEQTDSGYISSPNWPYSFASEQQCKWILDAGEAKVIRVRIHRLVISELDSLLLCSANEESTSLPLPGQTPANGSFCINLASKGTGTGTGGGGSMLLGRKVAVHFHSSRLLAQRSDVGFTLSYEAVPLCGQIFTAIRGQFASPEWPRRHSVTTNCSWTIRAREGSTIRIRFENFSLEGSANFTDCPNRYDYVFLYGNTFEPTTLCGERKPFEIVAEDTSLTVVFVSNKATEKATFAATYEVYERLKPTDKSRSDASTKDELSTLTTPFSSELSWEESAENLTYELESFQLIPIAAEAVPVLTLAANSQFSKLQIWGIVSGGLVVLLGIVVIIFTMRRRCTRRGATLASPWLSSHAAHDRTIESDVVSEVLDQANGEIELMLLGSPAYQRALSEDDGYISDIASWQTDRPLGQQQQQQSKARSLAMSMHESCY